MKLGELQNLLDRYGADLATWPPVLRQGAEALLEHSPEARTMLARALRLTSLIGMAEAPPAPALDDLVEEATRHLQALPVRVRRHEAPHRWFGLGRWHVAAFASCLFLGILIGAVSAPSGELPDSIYSLIDVSLGPATGEGL